MAAPKGNQFWKMRSKHGRDSIFASATILWDAAVEYFIYTDGRKWVRVDFKGKDSDKVEIPTDTPYTLTGLSLFLGVHSKYFTEFEKKCSEDFTEVITRIREIIYTQKFEGAAVGAYNGNIIARDLGLADKKDFTGTLTLEDLIDGSNDDKADG